MDNKTVETCMFFVDDSNIWIEAQKFAASGNRYLPKLEDSDRDTRLRIDIGKLVDTLRNTREQGLSFLYGSRPPSNDSVWNAFETKFKFRTRIYNRNARNKEKEVDNSMATDLTYEATRLHIGARYESVIKQEKQKTTFIVITGDRDMLPPVKKVLDSAIRVELWGWRSGIAKEYYNEKNERKGLLSINHLDDEFNKIFFTNFRSTRKGNLAQQVDPARTIVLCGFDELGAEDLDEDWVGKELIQLRRMFYISPSTSTAEMFVEFPAVANNVESMIVKSRQLFKGILGVMSWPEYNQQYAQRFNKSAPDLVAKKNMYKPLTDDDGHNHEQVGREFVKEKAKSSRSAGLEAGSSGNEEKQDLTDLGNNDGWSTVTRSDLAKGHRRALRQTQNCPDGIRCRRRGECGYLHSKEERDLFENNPKQNFALWKTKRCTQAHCRRGSKCRFAHTQEAGWCLHCKHGGHCTDECEYA